MVMTNHIAGVGSINISAALQYCTPGHGVDIDTELVQAAETAALQRAVSHLVTFAVEDVMATDLSRATAVVSFLVPRHLKLLKPKLETFLSRGGRLACYHYPLQGVQPSKVVQLKEGFDKSIFIYKL